MTLMVESLRINNPFAGVIQRGQENLAKLTQAAQEGIAKAQAVGSYVVANRETIAREVVKNTKANAPAMAAGAATRIGLAAEAGILGASTAASVVALPAVAVAVGVGSAVAKYGIEEKRMKKIGVKAFFDLHAGRHMRAEEAEKPQARGIAGSILHAVKETGDFAAHGLEERTVSGAFKVQERRKNVARVISNISEASAREQSVFEHYQGRVSRVLGSANTQLQNKVALRMLKKDTQDAFVTYLTATNSDVKANARKAYMSLRDVHDSNFGEEIHVARQARRAELKKEVGKNAKSAVRGMANIQLVKAPLRVATGAFLADSALKALGFVKDRVGEAASAVQQGLERVREDVEQSVNVATSGTPLPPVSSNSIKMASLSTGGSSLPPTSGDNSPAAVAVSNVKKGDIGSSPVKLDRPSPPLHPQIEPPADPPPVGPSNPPNTVTLKGGQKIQVYSPSSGSTTGDVVRVGNTEVQVFKPASNTVTTDTISQPAINNNPVPTGRSPDVRPVVPQPAVTPNNAPYVPSYFNPDNNLQPTPTTVIPRASEVVVVAPLPPAVSTTSVNSSTVEYVTLQNGVKIPIYKPAVDTVTARGQEIPIYKPPVDTNVSVPKPNVVVDPRTITDTTVNNWSDAVKAMQEHPVTSFSSLDLANSAAQKISITSSRPDIFAFPQRPFTDWKLNWDQTRVPAVDQAFFFASPDGGLIVQPHSGYLADRAGNNLEQFFEPVRRFLEGGNNGIPRFTEAQTLARLDQLNKLKPTITLTQGGRKLNLVLENAGILPRDSVIANGFYAADPTRLSGGADTMTFVFCTRSYADGIKVFDTVADAIPASLKAEFAILHNPNATGAQVQDAIVKLAKWLETHDKPKYMEFRRLYDYLGKTSPEIQREFPDMYSWGRAKLTFKVVR